MTRTCPQTRHSSIPSSPEFKSSLPFAHPSLVTLSKALSEQPIGTFVWAHFYADRNIGKYPHVHLRPFDDFNLPLYCLLRRGKLLSAYPRAISFDSDPPCAISQRSSFDRATDWYGDSTLVTLDMLDLFRCKLRTCP
jgi:hypothetical protein